MNQFFLKNSLGLKLFLIALSSVLLVIDYFSEPFIQFPITYLVPICLTAWYSNRFLALSLAVLMPLIRFFFNIFLWDIPWTFIEAGINCVIRIIIFSSFVFLLAKIALQTKLLEKEVKLLEGLLPICSFCKKIRDSSQTWQPLEKYIGERSEASFSHRLCPTCMHEHYGEVFNKK